MKLTMNFLNHIPKLGVHSIFDRAQKNGHSHQRLMKELIQLYKSDNSGFISEYLQCLVCCMVDIDKHSTYEKSLDFAVKYCIYHENALEDEKLLYSTFQFIFNYHTCESHTIRFRCCDFISKLLSGKGEQAAIDFEIYDRLTKCMLDRLKDKLPTVRAQAVFALQRLQDPHNEECEIIKEFLFHMEHDVSADVRARIVKSIALTAVTIKAIFSRIYDVKITVRKEAIEVLSRLKIRNLTIDWRQKILKMGYRENEELVQKGISKIILKWFVDCNENYLELLKLIDVETLEIETTQFVLFLLFKKQPSAGLIDLIKPLQTLEKLIPIDKLKPSVAALWLAIVNYIAKCKADSENIIEIDSSEILPELTRFTKYMKAFSVHLLKGKKDKEFVMLQLIKIASSFSLSDEMGRENLKQIYRMLLTDDNVEIGLVSAIVKHLVEVVPSVEERSVILAEIISDIREPLQDSHELSQENENGDFMLDISSEHSVSLDSERNVRSDPAILIKCLTIVIEFMKGKDVTRVNGTLLSLKDHFIMTCFKENNVQVVQLAQDALALMCIWNLKLAQDNFINFCIQISDDSACISAVKTIFDLILVHGFDNFSCGISDNRNEQRASGHSPGTLNDFPNDSTLNSPLKRYIIPLFISLLHNNNPDMRAVVSQGLAKLLLACHINSPLVLGHLIIIWFSPVTEKEPLVRQPLGAFFHLFSRKRPGAGYIIINSVIPTLKGLDEFSEDDMFSNVNQLSVIKLLVSLVSPDIGQPPEQGGSYHFQLALLICGSMMKISSSALITLLSKTLLLLMFSPEDRSLASNLLTVLRQCIKKMNRHWERRILRNMETFKKKIESLADGALVESQQLELLENGKTNGERNEEENVVRIIEENQESEMEYDDEESIGSKSCPENGRNGVVSDSDCEMDNDEPMDDQALLSQHSENDISDDEQPENLGVVSETSSSEADNDEEITLTNYKKTAQARNNSKCQRLIRKEERKSTPRRLRSGRTRNLN